MEHGFGCFFCSVGRFLKRIGEVNIPEGAALLTIYVVAAVFICIVLIMVTGCATIDPAKPGSLAGQFPLRNQDPRVGLVVNQGTAPMDLFIYDQANRLVEQVYLSGADRYVTVNGQPTPQYWVRRLEPGYYRIEAYPFYYRIRLIPPMRYRIDLPKQVYSVYVGNNNNPTSYYYAGRHWAWLLQLGVNIPEGGDGLPFGIRLMLPNL